MNRRTLLTTGTTLSIASLSGCLGFFQSDPESDEPEEPTPEPPTQEELPPIPPEYITEAENYISDAPNSEQDYYDARTEPDGQVEIETQQGLSIFNPAITVITANMSIQWTADEFEYTIIHDAENPEFDSAVISDGETYTEVFPEPGVYPYFCELNQRFNMKGAIIVTESPSDDE